MGWARKKVDQAANIVSDVASPVIDTVNNAVETVKTQVVDPVVKTAESTLKTIADDPIKAAAIAAAVATGQPELIPYIQGAATLASGASPEEALLAAGKAYALSQAGQAVGAQVGSATVDAGAGADAAKLASGAASGATRAALTGGDPLSGAITGGLSAGTGVAAKNISDQQFEDWAKEQAAKTYDNAPSPTEQDVLAADPNIQIDYPLSTPTTETGPGYYDEITGKFIPSDISGLQAPLTEASGTGTIDAPVLDMTGLNPQPTEFTTPADTTAPEAYDPLATTSQIKSGLDLVKNSLLSPTGTSTTLGSTGAQTTAPLAAVDFTPKFLDTTPQFLSSKGSTSSPAHLQELKQLYAGLVPEMAAVFADRGIEAPPEITNPDTSMTTTKFMADGGLADSLNPTEKSLGFVKPYAANLLPAAPLMSNPMKLNPLRHLQESLINRQRTAGGLAHGGLPQKYADAIPAGHKPEFITGLTGYYASGKGTGQSDDIDAMLHDGDYVADADLVAALGDGSSKAGAEALEKFRRQIPHQEHAVGGAAVPAKIADGEYVFPASFVTAIGQGDNKAGAKILDKMREAIRAHKRSAPTTKIPPKSKSPLEYLKMVKG